MSNFRRMLMTAIAREDSWDFEVDRVDTEDARSKRWQAPTTITLGMDTIAGEKYHVEFDYECMVYGYSSGSNRIIGIIYQYNIYQNALVNISAPSSVGVLKKGHFSGDFIANKSSSSTAKWNIDFRYCTGNVKIKNYTIKKVEV